MGEPIGETALAPRAGCREPVVIGAFEPQARPLALTANLEATLEAREVAAVGPGPTHRERPRAARRELDDHVAERLDLRHQRREPAGRAHGDAAAVRDETREHRGGLLRIARHDRLGDQPLPAHVARARRFAFAAGVGIDATMVAEASATLKRHFGVPAYMLSWVTAALRRETFRARVTVDGELIERDASAVMLANFGAVLNDLIRLGPGILHDDGKLDLCVFSPGTARDAVRVAWKLLRKDFQADPCMLYRAGRQFHVETFPPRPVQADGELLGDTPFDVTVEPLAAQLLVPDWRAVEAE